MSGRCDDQLTWRVIRVGRIASLVIVVVLVVEAEVTGAIALNQGIERRSRGIRGVVV